MYDNICTVQCASYKCRNCGATPKNKHMLVVEHKPDCESITQNTQSTCLSCEFLEQHFSCTKLEDNN